MASLDAIQAVTLREARSIISSDALQGILKLSYHLDVEDASGAVVHSLEFEDAVNVLLGAAAS